MYAGAAVHGEARGDGRLWQKGSLVDQKVKFICGDRLNRLAQRPDITEGVSRIRSEIDEADRTYAMAGGSARRSTGRSHEQGAHSAGAPS